MKNNFLIIWIGSKNLRPINAKSLLGCQPMMQREINISLTLNSHLATLIHFWRGGGWEAGRWRGGGGGQGGRGFFFVFPWFPMCSRYVPFKFPMGSQSVPQHVLHSTSLLSHIFLQMLSSFHVYRCAKRKEFYT